MSTPYDPLFDPSTNTAPDVHSVDLSLRMAREALDRCAPKNIHADGQMLTAAVELDFALRQLVTALDAAPAASASADRPTAITTAANELEHALTVELDDDRALALHAALIVLRSKLPCTCARSQGLHEKCCRRYVPGHELLSPARRLAAARAELRRKDAERGERR
ncbi:hypothetical protein [Streptomyces sp. NPDC050164]|uniref:hypothetical protein n=1 Tax=Streptomyces sp. NPDC050164 TaxID=3365605 RepID=UPI00378ECF88